MKIGQKSDLGRVRQNNEDCLFVDGDGGLFIVADGMGGIIGGEVASFIAVQVVSQRLRPRLPMAGGKEEAYSLLMDALLKAHETIRKRTEDQKELSGMGTTIVVALVSGERFYVAHVGDSRAYLVRGKSLKQLTEDHSVVAQILKTGMITGEEARTHRLRHVLSQALGSAPSLTPSLQEHQLMTGDRLMLCTDGLTDMVGDAELLSVITRNPGQPQAACDKLVLLANEKGGRDNISLIILSNE